MLTFAYIVCSNNATGCQNNHFYIQNMHISHSKICYLNNVLYFVRKWTPLRFLSTVCMSVCL